MLPDEWTIVFHRRSVHWWVNALPGRYKHVSALAYLPSASAWLLYDVELVGTRLLFLPHDQTDEVAAHIEGADLMNMPAVTRPRRAPLLAPFTCVSAVAHMIGARGALFRPDALWRYCEANGGVWINGPEQRAAATGRQPDGASAGGGGGQRRCAARAGAPAGA